ncbi:MAG: type II toxin-antitoxin system Phd/YefM family antitoxin [Kofleriaceae bacterium]
MKPENIVPITELKRDAAGLIERAAEERNPIVITQNGRATAVVQDIHSFHAERQAFAMLALCMQGQRDIAEGRTVTRADARARIDALFERFKSK